METIDRYRLHRAFSRISEKPLAADIDVATGIRHKIHGNCLYAAHL